MHYQSKLSSNIPKAGTAWLSEPVSLWDQIPAVQKLAQFAHNMPLSNAAAERMVKRTVDFANYGARGEEDFQAVLQTVGASISRVPSRKTKLVIQGSHMVSGTRCPAWSD